MKPTLFIAFCLWSLNALALPAAAEPGLPPGTNITQLSQATMSPESFRKIAAAPGDAVPLIPQLARLPFWTNSMVSIEMKYVSGEVFKEEVEVKARTVSGKYLVSEGYSQFYHQQITSILAYDEKAACLKLYGLYADAQGKDLMTEGMMRYNFEKNTYTFTSEYSGGFKETTRGTHTATGDIAKSEVFKNGVLFMTRVIKTRPLAAK